MNNQRFSYTDSHLRRMIQLIDSFTMNPMIGLLVGHLSSEDVPTCAGGHPLPQVASPVQLDVSPHPGEHGRVQAEDARTGQGRQRLVLGGRGADGGTSRDSKCFNHHNQRLCKIFLVWRKFVVPNQPCFVVNYFLDLFSHYFCKKNQGNEGEKFFF